VEMTGVGGTIVNDLEGETDPSGVCTVRLTVTGDAIRLAGIMAVNWFPLTKVVANAEPFHCTLVPETNPAPFTVRLKAGPPAVAEEGLRDKMAEPPVIVNVTVVDISQGPVLETLILATPGVAIREAGTVANKAVPLPTVASGDPFHCTKEFELKAAA
jgi:hypothetical protein